MNAPLRLFDIPYFQLEKHPRADAFTSKINSTWVPISTEQFLEKVNLLSRGLIARGVKPNDIIALVSGNRPEWNMVDFAVQQVGAILVPVYPNISSNDYQFIFNDAAIKFCFVGNEEILEKIAPLQSALPELEEIYSFYEMKSATNWVSLFDLADTIAQREVNERKANIRNKDLATIIYTSGTTGNPKGVMLSHNNLLSNVLACQPRIPAGPSDKALTFLPSCHVYERMLHYLYIYIGCSIYYAESMDTIGENLKEVQPQIFTAVPRLLEKVFDKIMAKGEGLKGIKRKLFFWAVELAEQYEVKGNSSFYSFKLAIANILIFSKWREAVGGKVKAIASGSAALQPRLARIYNAAKIPVLEGYGLTETSPVVSVNCIDNMLFGSVGPLIDKIQVKFAEDGEILVKGPNVMMGYYNNPEKTAEALSPDGWFHTGDIGELVDGVFLKITDRKKEIFKTSGGKYIMPQIMENKFKESRFIEQIIVIGEGKKFPAALVVPSYTFVKEWAKRKNIDCGNSNETLIENPKVIDRIKEEIESLNKEFGHWEMIKKIELLPHEFSIESGELTPTLKFKRKFILQKYAQLIDKIYNN
jgi:long-chain acyl-CoA synthetase